MKKIFTLFCAFLSCLITMSSVYASNFKPSIAAIPLMNVKQGNEEKVLHTLKNKRTRPVAYTFLSNSKHVRKSPVYATRWKNEDGTESINYITSTGEYISLENDQTLISSVYASGGSKTEKKYDKTLSVLFSLTITFKRKISNGDDNGYIKLTNVKGNFKIEQGGVQVKNQEVVFKQSSYLPYVDEVKSRKPKGNSFNYNTGFKKFVPDTSISTKLFGSAWSGSIKRGSSSWKFAIKNYKYLLD